MAKFKSVARIQNCKPPPHVLVSFRAVPGGYKSADDRECKDINSAREMIARSAERWGHEVDVVRV